MAGAVFLPQGSQDGVAGKHGRDEVADVNTNFHRRAFFFTIDVHQTSHSLDLRVVGRLVSVGAGLAVTGYGAINDPWVDLGDFLVAESDAAQGAWRQIFQDHITFFGHVQEHLLAFGRFQVNGDALNALSTLEEPGGDVIIGLALDISALRPGEWSVTTHRVTFTGYLDFNHLCAHAGQVHRAEGSGQIHSNCQDLDVFQRFHISPDVHGHFSGWRTGNIRRPFSHRFCPLWYNFAIFNQALNYV